MGARPVGVRWHVLELQGGSRTDFTHSTVVDVAAGKRVGRRYKLPCGLLLCHALLGVTESLVAFGGTETQLVSDI